MVENLRVDKVIEITLGAVFLAHCIHMMYLILTVIMLSVQKYFFNMHIDSVNYVKSKCSLKYVFTAQCTLVQSAV